MEQIYTLNLRPHEVNFIFDAMDSYSYVIDRLIDEATRESVKQILENVIGQIESQNIAMQDDAANVTVDENNIVDVEPEVVPNEE